VLVLAYHLAATSAGKQGNGEVPPGCHFSSPVTVGFAMEATATGAPGLPGRTGPAAVARPSLPLASEPVAPQAEAFRTRNESAFPLQTPANCSKAGAAAGAPAGWAAGPRGQLGSGSRSPAGLSDLTRASAAA
jgi:hypothetical protein